MAGQYSNFKVTDQLGCRSKNLQEISPGFSKRVKLPFFNFRNTWTNAFQNTISESTTSWILFMVPLFSPILLGYILLIGGFNPSEKY